VKTYAHEMENTSVRANLINPGPTRTRMRAKAFPGEPPETLKAPDALAPTFVRLAEVTCKDNGRVFDLKTGDIR
jgi:NAD(P)-dependent dehydrogenase (short-subunit alcohol dehydrogenase family)